MKYLAAPGTKGKPMTTFFIYNTPSILPWNPSGMSHLTVPVIPESQPTLPAAAESHQGIPGDPVLPVEEPKQRSTSASHCWKTAQDRCQHSV